ncbi:MAG: C45 family peptidase [Planctomycetota bacterium]
MLVFETYGGPFDRGKCHGHAVAHRNDAWMQEASKELVQHFKVNSISEAITKSRDRIQLFCDWWAAAEPDSLEECHGIAAGLDTEAEICLAYNTLYRLISSPAQCTVIGVLSDKNEPLIGKSDDVCVNELGANVIEISHPDKNYGFLSIRFAGTVWTFSGMNEMGLAAGLTGITGPTLEKKGVPSLIGVHSLLQHCSTVGEAIDYLNLLKMNFGGFSVLLGDAKGHMGLVEKNGAGTVILPCQKDGWYIHTNHILDGALALECPQQVEPIYSNSLGRYENAMQLVPQKPRDVTGIIELFSNRSQTGSIVQNGPDGLYTDYRAVYLPAEKKIIYMEGYKNDDKTELHLADFFG